jgi:hypothetical protein
VVGVFAYEPNTSTALPGKQWLNPAKKRGQARRKAILSPVLPFQGDRSGGEGLNPLRPRKFPWKQGACPAISKDIGGIKPPSRPGISLLAAGEGKKNIYLNIYSFQTENRQARKPFGKKIPKKRLSGRSTRRLGRFPFFPRVNMFFTIKFSVKKEFYGIERRKVYPERSRGT